MRRGEHYLLAHGPRLLGASTRRHKPSAVSRTRRRRATSSRRRAWATGVIFVIFGILVICAAPVARTAHQEVAGRPIRCAEMESVPGRRPRLVAETIRMALQDEPETAPSSASAFSSLRRDGPPHLWYRRHALEADGSRAAALSGSEGVRSARLSLRLRPRRSGLSEGGPLPLIRGIG